MVHVAQSRELEAQNESREDVADELAGLVSGTGGRY